MGPLPPAHGVAQTQDQAVPPVSAMTRSSMSYRSPWGDGGSGGQHRRTRMPVRDRGRIASDEALADDLHQDCFPPLTRTAASEIRESSSAVRTVVAAHAAWPESAPVACARRTA